MEFGIATDATTSGKGSETLKIKIIRILAKIPKRVEIYGKWYDVREGWAGKLELFEYMKSPEYTANEPFMHINNHFHVYNTSGSKVGEFHTDNRSYSGCVTNFEM